MVKSDFTKKHLEDMSQQHEKFKQQLEEKAQNEAMKKQNEEITQKVEDTYIKSIEEQIIYISIEDIHVQILRSKFINLLTIYILFLLVMIFGMFKINFYLFLPFLILCSILILPVIFSDYIEYRNFKRRMKL